MADVSMKKVKDLITKKDAIEQEIKEFQDVLDSQKGVGMNEKLIDEENYPRSDIDVYTVRVARNRIICLQNDHKALMKEIEEGIHEVHAQAREQRDKKETQQDQEMEDISTKLKAFLRVDSVADGSPSSQAGLKVGDYILKFGSINAGNFHSLVDIASVVQHSKGRPMSVTVKRGEKSQIISLTPNIWSGQGLLGCHIVPVK
ncbi:26S proteasome non-ATPase regulatory subunit 9-like isoform X1 [Stylophora pistillata]|uniref:26S proteasome non-ATPase regulatory subunit 9-like isoform X1 n=2 Tax=Stylophora pistillata TaxID=50429 RepID=UPI000C04D60A|nr:26S proteasome non-ATPase regulatory subunit 9-like isoform X1 [Stylophora pistillata]